MNRVDWRRHKSIAAQTRVVAALVLFIADDAFAGRSAPRLAITGGRSPIRVLDFLRSARFAWQRVTVVPTDDRLVAQDDLLGTYVLLQRGLT